MGVNTVQNHPNAPSVGGIAHGGEVFHRAQHGIRRFVITGVIAVIGKTLTDGVQVQNGRTQRGDIVHFFCDSPEIAAEKVVIQDLALGIGSPIHFLVPIAVYGVGFQLPGKIHLADFAEAVREDLVHSSALRPLGNGKIRRNTADLPKIAIFHVGIVAVFEETETAGLGGDIKIIEVQSSAIEEEITTEDLVRTLCFLIIQTERKGTTAIFSQNDAFHLRGLHGGGDMDAQCAVLFRYQRAERIFELQLLTVVQNTHRCLLIKWQVTPFLLSLLYHTIHI